MCPLAARLLPATYILPIRRHRIEDAEELTSYLLWLADRIEVIVVDGSPPTVFAHHARLWSESCLHIPPAEEMRSANGKAWGVNTGLQHASHDRVIIADDDVRYDASALARMVALLDRAEVVRPQNYFSPVPWHACWDTARSLLNRAVAGDWPGTLGIRGGLIEGYDGNVLFENLELCRTIEGAGGRHLIARDLYVRRLPPTAGHFWSQRVRQAYDEFARPPLLLGQLLILPALVWLIATGRRGALAAVVLTSVALAESGRRRADGTRFFPPLASAFAPVWLLERGVCSWLAVWQRIRFGGVRYGGTVVPKAANPASTLSGRYQDARPSSLPTR